MTSVILVKALTDNFLRSAKVIPQPPPIPYYSSSYRDFRGSQVSGVLGCQEQGRGFKAPLGEEIVHARMHVGFNFFFFFCRISHFEMALASIQ